MVFPPLAKVSQGDGVSPTESEGDASGDVLQQVCARLLAIMKPNSASFEPTCPGLCLTMRLREELADIVRGGIREMAVKLRRELAQWTATSEQLQQLERCRYLALPDQVRALAGEFTRAKQQAERVTEALMALGTDVLYPP